MSERTVSMLLVWVLVAVVGSIAILDEAATHRQRLAMAVWPLTLVFLAYRWLAELVAEPFSAEATLKRRVETARRATRRIELRAEAERAEAEARLAMERYLDRSLP